MKMIQRINGMLHKRKAGGSPCWLTKVLIFAQQLEGALYQNADSFDANADMCKFKQRLQKTVVQIQSKNGSNRKKSRM